MIAASCVFPARLRALRAALGPVAPAVVPALALVVCMALAVCMPAAWATEDPQAAPPAGAPAAPKRNIAGPGDFVIREKLIQLFTRDAELGKETFHLVMVNGGAVFSGEIKSCTARKRALTIAATIRGVINVTDEMTVRRAEVPDSELARAVAALLGDASEGLGLKDQDVRVEDGVLTLGGTVKDVAARGLAEDLAGTVMGITRISNQLRPAGAPAGADDASLLKAVLDYLSDFHQFSFGGDLRVRVDQGVVTLKGKVGLYMARQQAAVVTSLVKGVARVDNRIKVDPAHPGGRMASIQAER